ncbi:hypothetical protein [Marinobacter caseinilyticus]|uniref:hypothetical protein n=1 Tax=Marinobacter caseinilyticus TaxID=2692195 RepID=UPI00140D17C4|nr:hypothetical protein [Marinobacter caseinilyticus]
MPNCTSGSKITCEFRCLAPTAVREALSRLDPAGVQWVSYTCQISGATESLLLIGDDLASRLVGFLPEVDDIGGVRVLAGLYSAQLCECDVATLTGLPEEEVVSKLTRFASHGLVAHQHIYGMNYYRLDSDIARRTIGAAVERAD